MNLPELYDYRLKLEAEGVTIPLTTVPNRAGGILKDLPKALNTKTGWPWTEETSPSVYQNRKWWPKISIITPSFNQGSFLEETLRSILLQNYPNLELIVLDGGSTDNTVKVLQNYSRWISYWHTKKDDGQGQAINMGFSIASGDYFAWINSDDYYLKDIFHQVIQTFLRTKTQIVYGYGYNSNLKDNSYTLAKVLPSSDLFLKIPGIIQPSTFWSSRIHKPIWEELHSALDYELWLRLFKGNERVLIKEALSVTNIHINAKTYNPDLQCKWHEDHVKIWSKEGHGSVPEWRYILFLNRLRQKIYNWFKLY